MQQIYRLFLLVRINTLDYNKNVKKLFLTLLIILLLCLQISALDMTAEIESFRMHPDFWSGFLPSYVSYKYNFNLLRLIENRNTEISLTLSTGVIPRTITQNPANGEPLSLWRENPVVQIKNNITGVIDSVDTSSLIQAPYDAMTAGWSARFGQGFGDSVEAKKDKFEVWISFDGEWERALNPILQLDRKGYPFENPIFDYELENEKVPLPYYNLSGTPDLIGDQQILSMSFNLGFDINNLVTQTAKVQGFDLKLKLTWSPKVFSSFFSGTSSYFKFHAHLQGGIVLSKDSTNWSLLLEEAAEMRILTGKYVPMYAQSMESNVWGLDTENVTFFIRNSLKLHYYGKQFLNDLCVPSAYLFIDLGYGGGFVNNTNSTKKSNAWTGSTGINLDLQLMEVLHVYYELGYIFLDGGDEAQRGFYAPKNIKFLVKIQYKY